MKDNIIKILVYIIIVLSSIQTYSQGVVSRTTKPVKTTQIQTNTKAQKLSFKVNDPDGYINGHGYVDLGLPSGTKWATCNVGASAPQEYGNYFAWGITSSKKNSDNNNQICGKSKSELISMGVINSSGNLTAKYDAASVNWRGHWRMPTDAEIKELIDKCRWEWTIISGEKGCIVTGPNKKSIFIPAAGYQDPETLSFSNFEKSGCYWSSTYDNNGRANGLYFSNDKDYISMEYQLVGQSIRPVIK